MQDQPYSYATQPLKGSGRNKTSGLVWTPSRACATSHIPGWTWTHYTSKRARTESMTIDPHRKWLKSQQATMGIECDARSSSVQSRAHIFDIANAAVMHSLVSFIYTCKVHRILIAGFIMAKRCRTALDVLWGRSKPPRLLAHLAALPPKSSSR